jgi:ABC-2 type transport system permease protein
VNVARTLRKIAAFFWRDFSIARGYRTALVLQLVEALFGVATFFYLSRFVESPQLERALPPGSNYFAFALVGFTFFDYMSVAFTAFDASIEEARQNRTLEALLVTQTPLPVILAGSAVYPFFALALRTCVYLAWGALFFHFVPRAANWPGAAVVLLASILAFSGLGILCAAYQILFKRGNPVRWLLLGVSGLVGGMMYPVTVLPGPLQIAARLIPVTYSLEGMRAALLAGAPWSKLAPSIVALLAFAAVLLPLSFAVFAWALRRTKITGTLTHI